MITYRLIELVVKVMQSSCAPRSRERPNPIAIFIVLVLHKKMTILSQQRCTLKKLMLRVKQSLQRLAKICISFSNLFESSGQKVEAKRVSFFLVPNQTAFFFPHFLMAEVIAGLTYFRVYKRKWMETKSGKCVTAFSSSFSPAFDD